MFWANCETFILFYSILKTYEILLKSHTKQEEARLRKPRQGRVAPRPGGVPWFGKDCICFFHSHYHGATWGSWCLKSPATWTFSFNGLFGLIKKKHGNSTWLTLCQHNPLETKELFSQRTSTSVGISLSWCHDFYCHDHHLSSCIRCYCESIKIGLFRKSRFIIHVGKYRMEKKSPSALDCRSRLQ